MVGQRPIKPHKITSRDSADPKLSWPWAGLWRHCDKLPNLGALSLNCRAGFENRWCCECISATVSSFTPATPVQIRLAYESSEAKKHPFTRFDARKGALHLFCFQNAIIVGTSSDFNCRTEARAYAGKRCFPMGKFMGKFRKNRPTMAKLDTINTNGHSIITEAYADFLICYLFCNQQVGGSTPFASSSKTK